ncbi:type I-U CRISPR-associated protein Csb2 [Candidatus Poriferisodalis sp.]|uniref:type I-G CRISPR-associated protein Csb2 n=1 Tax=Candidatus Poriferisodalis sp. TaxID=3101277 RepID=UPI003B02309B
MIAIEVTLLTGRYVATAHHDRHEHEWPPHPARLFSALVSAWADSDTPDPAERAALEWLEALGAPTISASLLDDVVARTPVGYFVPVNDAAVATGSAPAARVLPEGVLPPSTYAWHKNRSGKFQRGGERGDWITGRGKQERQFPSVTPPCAIVTFAWSDTPELHMAGSLDGLLARVTRIGHSSSLVSCRLIDDCPEPTLLPGSGSLVLRCTQRGQLAALEAAHRQHQGMRPRALPFVGVRYSEQTEAEERSPTAVRPDNAGDLVVFELPIGQRRFPTIRTVELTEALRGATFRHADDPLPEGLSGHLADGRPSRHPHVAFLALPNVGHDYADGRIMGLAAMLPASLPEEAANAAYRAIGTWEQAAPQGRCRLTLGGEVMDLHRRQPPFELSTLRTATWSRPSSEWISATPIALPKNPGRLTSGSPAARARAWAAAEEEVRQSCIHVGLPDPAAVAVSLDPLLPGARPAGHYPAFVQGTRRGEGVRRRLVHAAVRFDQDISGPLVLGSGRFLGLGLMRPAPTRSSPADDGQPVGRR